MKEIWLREKEMGFLVLFYFDVHIKFSLILWISFPHECKVLSSAKLQISDFYKRKENIADEYIK